MVENLLAGPLRKKQLKNEVQRRIQQETDTYWREKIATLVMQGDFLGLLVEEDSNVSWKSILWGLPKGVAKFVLNAGLNTLPTGDNLKRWGKRTSDACKVCRGLGRQTLHHLLSSCNASLEQGRYTFRHDSCLRTISDSLMGKLNGGYEIFTDLTGRGSRASGTVPLDVVPTTQRPDIVILNRTDRRIVLFELTVPWDSNVGNAHQLKMDKYAALVGDLENAGYRVNLFCFEVSVRGQITKANKARLKSFLFHVSPARRSVFMKLANAISKAALLGSFSIYCARDEVQWSIGGDVSVQL